QNEPKPVPAAPQNVAPTAPSSPTPQPLPTQAVVPEKPVTSLPAPTLDPETIEGTSRDEMRSRRRGRRGGRRRRKGAALESGATPGQPDAAVGGDFDDEDRSRDSRGGSPSQRAATPAPAKPSNVSAMSATESRADSTPAPVASSTPHVGENAERPTIA